MPLHLHEIAHSGSGITRNYQKLPETRGASVWASKKGCLKVSTLQSVGNSTVDLLHEGIPQEIEALEAGFGPGDAFQDRAELRPDFCQDGSQDL